MKFVISFFISTIVCHSYAANTKTCSDAMAQIQVAQDAVVALVELADTPKVERYETVILSEEGGQVISSVLPNYQDTKDWYKVVLRISDCRVINVHLAKENLPIHE